MSDAASQPFPLQPDEDSASPGDRQEVRWETVARTAGLVPATIIAGRLRAEGIPTRAWQEGAGRALGLTVGLLGTGYVDVPEEYADQALEILSADMESDGSIDWESDETGAE